MPRGGARVGAGRKKKPLADKLLEGNPGKRELTVLKFGEPLPEGELPPPPQHLSTLSRCNGNYPTATEIHQFINSWLRSTNCLQLINPHLIEDYAVNRAAWLECEYMLANFGRIIEPKDDDESDDQKKTKSPKRSPYVGLAVIYYEAYRQAWAQIWSVVAANSTKKFQDADYEVDPMEALLSHK